MDIHPDRNTFNRLVASSSRVPVCGQRKTPNLNLSHLFQHLFQDTENTFLFESGKGPEETARYSLMGRADSKVLEIKGQQACLYKEGIRVKKWDRPNSALQLLDFEKHVHPVDYLPHFWGGWVGFIGYEAGAWFESLPVRESSANNFPDLSFMQIERLYLYDHLTHELKYIVSSKSNEPGCSYDELCGEIKSTWKELLLILEEIGERTDSEVPSSHFKQSSGLSSNLSKADYTERVEKAKEYIREGDVYQTNLAQKFETHFTGNPFELYANLRKVNPSPFSGYLNFKNFSLVSSSPERLVKVHEHSIETRPIAGTRPRGKEIEEDQALSAELLLNPKERAEHLMLVDLERNDLGRICEAGSVNVTDFMFLEKYSHVSHIVSNITGDLKPETSVYDILKSVFPGGTITGCPKIRCMEIISELEPDLRGPYSGSFGYIGFGPYMDLNIIIRSIVISNKVACFHVGAGIVADSNPQKEYQETLDKAAAMIQALSS
ncbi:MAG: anthranilate synthase component I family protein [Nitrospina sp.]|jgi:anthranilate synthase component 1/para-aminobenzoate synthetase component 1|nr:anthranilate synthase component I family protein [Nitrospina sp.]MBT3875896.1 anthranilate synthase component I family protein [Nitrospina sp.]MBT4046969.1 anthranilate synthase component I family protein [Nitrospina sp.]MBT4557311.1 anthranilate synthase component I family protein [Nitrospina sp.]MBT5347583.1 anthranilate synthase component I family protein [Nitrospina sp.]